MRLNQCPVEAQVVAMLAALVVSFVTVRAVQGMINGHDVDLPTKSSIVSIHETQNGPLVCTGVLMTPRHVLTAEHCFLGAKWVKLGRGNTDEVLEINAFNVHPKAREWPVVKYDIAVVRLKQASKQQPPARLGFDSVSIGAPVVVRGRGVTAFGRINRPKQVREMNGTVVAASACEQALREPNPIHESMMCISGVFVCRGDSGGAVSIVQENGDEVVVALQSLGVKECNESTAVYTRVSTAREFIEPFLSTQPASSPQTIHQPSLSPPEDAKQPYSCANMPPRPSLASTDW
ncbi:unnamed protein product [Aphanomyces euteiches]|uniref:Peptidase S1 domain-containing protein n=1 Tax=Aphanomyces euteiches TaxID=100861 RepID=A0A6G0XE94_9STRA|nr:hypothetical protein Ae201684_005774 [Aphanomyces euteiches]KAH9078472.1 hypothetical protein Ae201684P_019557 [Aphanomyces euteiches]